MEGYFLDTNLFVLLVVGSESREVVVASADASSNVKFEELGLTDAALLEVITTDIPLLTVDLGLYLAAFETGEERAINFNRYRNL